MVQIKLSHLEKLLKNKMEYDVPALWKSIRGSIQVMSWGVSHFANYNKKALCLKVNGHHFDGVVFITLHVNDTFSIYYLKERLVLDEKHDVYIDDLINVIDGDIEYIKSYAS